MMDALNLDGVTMFVSATADNGVVGAGTHLTFSERGARVLGRYRGGNVCRGWLVGQRRGIHLSFRYVQLEACGEIHAGRSRCMVSRAAGGRIRIVEHFSWSTRAGQGINVFDELC